MAVLSLLRTWPRSRIVSGADEDWKGGLSSVRLWIGEGTLFAPVDWELVDSRFVCCCFVVGRGGAWEQMFGVLVVAICLLCFIFYCSLDSDGCELRAESFLCSCSLLRREERLQARRLFMSEI